MRDAVEKQEPLTEGPSILEQKKKMLVDKCINRMNVSEPCITQQRAIQEHTQHPWRAMGLKKKKKNFFHLYLVCLCHSKDRVLRSGPKLIHHID